MNIFRPARPVEPKDDDEVLCDLDVVLDRRATFRFQGKTHALLPVTTERFLEFWNGVLDFQNRSHDDAEESNKSYLSVISILCESVTLNEVKAMTILQKADLLKHLTSKIVGKQILETSSSQKKKLTQSA